MRFLNPQSIAVVGGKESERVLEQCAKLDYQGTLWAVNPHREKLAGIASVKHVSDLPGVPDAVFLGIAAESSIESVRALENMGAGGVVCLASGYKEVGEMGEERQDRLIQAAGSMPVLGPNCYGYVNALTGAALFPDQHGMHRIAAGVAIITASGNLGINFTLQQRNLPIAWLITVGNQAVMGIEEALEAALECAQIQAVGIHVEGFKHIERFIELAGHAREKGIPIIALKTGKSETGAKIARSHTAVLSGESRLYAALFDRLGIGQVDTAEEFLEALKLACVHGFLKDNRLVSMSCSGGEASLIADLAMHRNVRFPAFAKEHAALLKQTLNEYVVLSNPLDYHTFIWGDYERTYRLFAAMMKGDFDLFILIIDFPDPDRCDNSDWLGTVRAFVAACQAQHAKGAVVSSIAENLTPEISQYLIDNRVVPLNGMSQALAAIEALSQAGLARRRSVPPPKISRFDAAAEAGPVKSLDEHSSKKLLQSWQVSVPLGERADSLSEALEAAARIGFPVAVKALDSGLIHKSDAGAVMIGVSDLDQFETGVRRLLEKWGKVRVEKMVDDAVAELMVGVSHDGEFGHFLLIGAGGTLVEILKDNQLLMLPVDEEQIRNALQALAVWPLMNGYRGRKRADADALTTAIKRIAEVIERHGQDICELEVNPLIAGASGAVAADALIRMNESRWKSWTSRIQ